jgi:hypothetical protein
LPDLKSVALADNAATMNPRQRATRIFRWFYKAFYWVLCLVLFGLVVITPIDLILQAWSRTTSRSVKTSYLIIIGGAYLLTLFLATLLYALRLWENRKTLNEIPKTCIPVEAEDVPKDVRKLIVGGLISSAVIAWEARPRVQRNLPETVLADANMADPVASPDMSADGKDSGISRQPVSPTEKGEQNVDIRPILPVWGHIAHNGWNSPASPEHPDLQYTSVILELPHLIEAQAVAIAPLDRESTSNPRMPDIRAVDLLQRPVCMGLRDYISHLIEVGVLKSAPTTTEFLAAYEHARFSPKPLSEQEFYNLLKLFGEVLQSMQPLSTALLASLDEDTQESDIDDDASSKSTPRSRSPASGKSARTRSGSEGTIRTVPSRRIVNNDIPTSKQALAAPATPKSKKRVISSSPARTFSQTRRPYIGSSSSSSSLSSGQGSVIRLSPTNDPTELPYTLIVPGAR